MSEKQHGASRWGILGVCLAAGVAAGVAAVRVGPNLFETIPDDALSEQEKEAVFDCMHIGFMHEEAARECVETYGWQALPFYHAVIQDTEEQEWVRGNASIIAGLYHDPETPPLIIAFVEELIGPDMTQEQISAVALALDGLGFTGQETALSYLERMATRAYWEDRDAPLGTAEDEAWERTPRIFRKRAVRGLGLAPKGAGIDNLERIQREAADIEQAWTMALADARKRA